jgi:glycosyltransferase involved in cell wall biosynthesis
MLPAILGIKLFLKKPIIVTLRDYYPICPYGLCLNKNRKYAGCDLNYLLKEEVINYMRLYEPHSSFVYKIFHYISAINSKLTSKFLRFCLEFSDKIVCISKKQQKIYMLNSVTTKVIYNTNPIKKVQRKTSVHRKIIFVGRLTWGKGIYLFLSALKVYFSKYEHIKVIIIGNGLSSNRIQRNLKSSEKKYIKFKSHINHSLVLTYMKSAALVVIPSVWEEPFGRTALEAIVQGTPVVVTNRGGLPEIVKETKGGIVTEPTPLKLAQAIKQGISQQSRFRSNIKENWEKIRYTFAQQPITQYEVLYENLVKKNI